MYPCNPIELKFQIKEVYLFLEIKFFGLFSWSFKVMTTLSGVKIKEMNIITIMKSTIPQNENQATLKKIMFWINPRKQIKRSMAVLKIDFIYSSPLKITLADAYCLFNSSRLISIISLLYTALILLLFTWSVQVNQIFLTFSLEKILSQLIA